MCDKCPQLFVTSLAMPFIQNVFWNHIFITEITQLANWSRVPDNHTAKYNNATVYIYGSIASQREGKCELVKRLSRE